MPGTIPLSLIYQRDFDVEPVSLKYSDHYLGHRLAFVRVWGEDANPSCLTRMPIRSVSVANSGYLSYRPHLSDLPGQWSSLLSFTKIYF